LRDREMADVKIAQFFVFAAFPHRVASSASAEILFRFS